MLGACVEKKLGPPVSKAALAPTPAPSPSATPELKYPQAKPLNDRAPVKIRSDRLRYNDVAKETDFLGHVVAVQDTTTLYSDRLRSTSKGESARAEGNVVLVDSARKVELKAAEGEYTDSLGEASLKGGVILHSQDPYAIPVTVTGQSAWYRSLSRLASLKGGVTMLRGRITATAETADLCGDEDLATLEGDVEISLGDHNKVRSRRAVLKGREKSMMFEGGVKARLIPAELKEASLHPEQ
jgi:lipopolysaccharide transport protein LptA